jgi:NAD(P)-dependent dehydrogenase (short-subunit alcohol dehydrogenase family)
MESPRALSFDREGSTAPLMRSENTTVYTATKAAVDGVTGVLAKELAKRKIRVNSVNPGFTLTEGPIAILAPISWMVWWPRYRSVALVNPKKSPLS